MSDQELFSKKNIVLFFVIIISIFVVFVVLAAVPTQVSPVLNATSFYNRTNDNITVFNQSTADTDGDRIKNIIDWRLNNISIAVISLPFENETGINTTDYSSFSNNASVGNGSTATQPRFNSTGGFDGRGRYMFNSSPNQYLNISIATYGKTLDANITIAFWFMRAGATTDIILANHRQTSATPGGIVMSTNAANGTINFQLRNQFACCNTVATSTATVANTWYHIAASYDNTTARIYVNGLLEDSLAATGSLNNTRDFMIGNNPDGLGGNVFNGSVDEVMIFNRTLSPQQVMELYLNNTNKLVNNETKNGNEISACVTPNDWIDSGGALCTNGMIINDASLVSKPTQSTPILNATSSSNTTRDNITVFNQSTTDSDNGPVKKNIYDWRIANNSIAVLNLPFEAGSTNGTRASNGSTTDYSSYSNNATVVEAVWDPTGGHDGQGAYRFNGINSSIRITDNPTLNFSNPGGVSVFSWIKTNSTAVGQGIATRWQCGANTQSEFQFLLSSSRPLFSVMLGDGATANSISGNHTITTEWTHVGFTYNDSSKALAIYYNGNVSNSTLNTFGRNMTDGTLELRIGARDCSAGAPADGDSHFNGTIDEVLIFNRTLSPNQVMELYLNNTNKLVNNETRVNQEVSACVTPNDGTVDGGTLCTNGMILRSNSPPNTPSINQPSNNTVFGNSLFFSLNWSNSTDINGDKINYTLEIANTTNFSLPNMVYVNDSIKETSNTTGDVVNLTVAGVYYWRVLSTDLTDNSSYSGVRIFNISASNSAPSVPSLHALNNNSLIIRDDFVNVYLNWSNSTDSNGDTISYVLEVSNTSNFSLPNLEHVNDSITETSNTTGIFFLPEHTGMYYWRALATDLTLNSSYSEVRQFNYSSITGTPSPGGGAGAGADAGSTASSDKSSSDGAIVSGVVEVIRGNQGHSQAITINGGIHTLTFVKVSPESVTLRLESTPVEVTIAVKESRSVDLNSDGVDDVVITYDGYADGIAQLSIQAVSMPYTASGAVITTPKVSASSLLGKARQVIKNKELVTLIVGMIFVIVGLRKKKESILFMTGIVMMLILYAHTHNAWLSTYPLLAKEAIIAITGIIISSAKNNNVKKRETEYKLMEE